jgi:hypothetical protein
MIRRQHQNRRHGRFCFDLHAIRFLPDKLDAAGRRFVVQKSSASCSFDQHVSQRIPR